MANNEFYINANKELWNKRVPIHLNSEFYDVASFKAGKSSLNNIELEGVGDVKGKSLLHLQCHFGMDTISWARAGAVVTGMDFSEEAVRAARTLAGEVNENASFVCSDVYDLPANLNDQFDIVFTSYGAIGWLPDLDKWASVINHFVKPGGTFYIAEFHPVLWMMDDDFTFLKYSYFNDEMIASQSQGTYGERNANISMMEYGWNHSLDEVFGNLLKHHLEIVHFEEYPFSPYNCFNNTVKGSDGMFRIRGLENKIPMMYSLKAIKKSR